MHTRHYMIIKVSEIQNINFNEIVENHINDLLLSVDETKTYVKWETDSIPDSINNIPDTEGPYTNSEIKYILRQTAEWNSEL
jgi:hypothetical protein